MHYENTPCLETERLRLRKFREEDVEDFFLIMSDPEVNTFLPWFPVQSIEEAKALLEKQYLQAYEEPYGYHYAICLASDNRPIGYVNISCGDSFDFGYGLRKEFWHQGIVSEAGKAVLQRAKEANLPYVTATHDVLNPRSGEVMKRLGMTYCYSYVEQWLPKNIEVTFRLYQLHFDPTIQEVYQVYWNRYPHLIEKL